MDICFSLVLQNLMCSEGLALGSTDPPGYQEPVFWKTSFPTGDPRHGTHACWSTGGVCSETRAPGNFRSPRPGTKVSPSSRNSHSGTRTRELTEEREIKERRRKGEEERSRRNQERGRTGKRSRERRKKEEKRRKEQRETETGKRMK